MLQLKRFPIHSLDDQTIKQETVQVSRKTRLVPFMTLKPVTDYWRPRASNRRHQLPTLHVSSHVSRREQENTDLQYQHHCVGTGTSYCHYSRRSGSRPWASHCNRYVPLSSQFISCKSQHCPRILPGVLVRQSQESPATVAYLVGKTLPTMYAVVTTIVSLTLLLMKQKSGEGGWRAIRAHGVQHCIILCVSI